jgi:hypothetical protein
MRGFMGAHRAIVSFQLIDTALIGLAKFAILLTLANLIGLIGLSGFFIAKDWRCFVRLRDSTLLRRSGRAHGIRVR